MSDSGNDGGVEVTDEPAMGDLDYDALAVGDVVGRGGSAVVREATLPGDPGRVVALKEPHAAGDAPDVVVERFRREAATWADLDDHPNVVTVHDWATEPHPWLALEYYEAGSLADRAGDPGLAEALWTGARVAAALAHAHGEGIAHLDLTPGNVLLRATPGDDWPVPGVADWGMVRALGPETVNLEGLTPRYAAPEQFAPDRFGSPGAATDIYALGVVLYELLAGAPPFDSPPRALRDAVVETTPPPASGREPSLPAAVDDVLDRALAKDPEDRHGSMGEFRRELERLLAERTTYEPEESDAPAGSDAGTGEVGPATAPARESPYQRALDLAGEGFVDLSEAYFARRDPAPPLEAWRRGVTLADARAGRAVRREVAGDGDGERVALADRLLEGLAAGTDHVVLGPPGSGKSTVCKQVACEWFDGGHGPVFYRESGGTERFERPDALARRATDADGHALVVVEDAVRPAASAVFEFLERVRADDDVTVLLDARESEWREAGRGTDLFGTDPVAAGREAVEPVYVPRPDGHEHEQFVRAVEEAAGGRVEVDIDRLRTEVREAAAGGDEGDETRPGELFYLLHRLTAIARDPLADGETPTTLTDAVADVYADLAAAGDAALDVGVCANVLNAAGTGVHPELLHAVAPADSLAVDDAVDVLDGRVLFPREADWSDGTTAYPAVHEAWSTAFLAHCLDVDGEAAAAERFGRVVTRVLSLADDESRRERTADTLHGDTPYLARIESDPAGWTAEAVEELYVLGRERPKIAPLFGDGVRDSVTLPDACPADVANERPMWLGQMFLARGDYDCAERAFERLAGRDEDGTVERLLGLARVEENRGEYENAKTHAEACLELVEDAGRPFARARAQLLLGRARSGLGEYEAASTCYRAAMEGFETVGDRRRMANALNNVGRDAYLQKKYDRAREHHERSLEISLEIGDRHRAGNSHNELGLVARERGEYEQAREHHERSLALARELGDLQGEANNLGNLGIVFDVEGEHDRAREYFEQSLAIKREIGDRHGQANSLGNLGRVAQNQGEYEQAGEYFERCLDVSRELGSRHAGAIALRALGMVATLQGEYEQARQYFEQSLEAGKELDDPHCKATSHRNLGFLAHRQRRNDRASDHLRRALEVARDIDHTREKTASLRGLGELSCSRGEYEKARTHLERALDCIESVGDSTMLGRVQLSRARLTLATGDLEAARERASASRELFEEAGETHWVARSQLLLGRVVADANGTDDARQHWRMVLETFEDVRAPQDALATVQHLVAACRETGDANGCVRWCQRAEELLATAPEPVAEQHREWVRDACEDLEDA